MTINEYLFKKFMKDISMYPTVQYSSQTGQMFAQVKTVVLVGHKVLFSQEIKKIF